MMSRRDKIAWGIVIIALLYAVWWWACWHYGLFAVKEGLDV